MPDASQFTLGLFDNPALGWSIDTPKADPESLHELDDEDYAEIAPVLPSHQDPGTNLHLDFDRGLARGWPARARDNLAAIRLSKELEATGRTPSSEEQAALLRFVGFGATELAQNCFPLPGETGFRPGWEKLGRELAEAVTPAEYAALQRATQYAHYTPEPMIRGLWRAAQRLGFRGGRVLEPGMGTGLFFALLPAALRGACRLTGIEYDPVTARIARFVHPQTRVRCEDYTRSLLGGGFDLASGDAAVFLSPTNTPQSIEKYLFNTATSRVATTLPDGSVLTLVNNGISTADIQVPEPSSFLVLTGTLLGLGLIRQRLS